MIFGTFANHWKLELKMWDIIKNVRSGAIAIAFFGCYILPTIVAWLVFVTVQMVFPSRIEPATVFVGLVFLWGLFLGPVCDGYLAAHLSKVLPLAHGLVVSVVGCILYLIYLGFAANVGFLSLLVVPVVLLAGMFGAWIWQFRSKGAIEL